MLVFQQGAYKTKTSALSETEKENLRMLQKSIDEIKNTIGDGSPPANGSLKLPLGGKTFNAEVDVRLGQLKTWLEVRGWEVGISSSYLNGKETDRIFTFKNTWAKETPEEKPSNQSAQKTSPPTSKLVQEQKNPEQQSQRPTYSNYSNIKAKWANAALDFANKYLIADGLSMGMFIEQNIVPIINSAKGWSDLQKEQFLNYFVAIATFMPEQKLKAFCSLDRDTQIHPLASTLTTWGAQNTLETMFYIYRAASGEDMLQDDLQTSGSLLDFARLSAFKQKFSDISITDEATGKTSAFHANTINPYAIYEFSMFSAPAIAFFNREPKSIEKIFLELSTLDDFALMCAPAGSLGWGISAVQKIYGTIVPAFASNAQFLGNLSDDSKLGAIFDFVRQNSANLPELSRVEIQNYLATLGYYAADRSDLVETADGYLMCDLNRISTITNIYMIGAPADYFPVEESADVFESNKIFQYTDWYHLKNKSIRTGNLRRPIEIKKEYLNGKNTLTDQDGKDVVSGISRTPGARMDVPLYSIAVLVPFKTNRGEFGFDYASYDAITGEYTQNGLENLKEGKIIWNTKDDETNLPKENRDYRASASGRHIATEYNDEYSKTNTENIFDRGSFLLTRTPGGRQSFFGDETYRGQFYYRSNLNSVQDKTTGQTDKTGRSDLFARTDALNAPWLFGSQQTTLWHLAQEVNSNVQNRYTSNLYSNWDASQSSANLLLENNTRLAAFSAALSTIKGGEKIYLARQDLLLNPKSLSERNPSLSFDDKNKFNIHHLGIGHKEGGFSTKDIIGSTHIGFKDAKLDIFGGSYESDLFRTGYSAPTYNPLYDHLQYSNEFAKFSLGLANLKDGGFMLTGAYSHFTSGYLGLDYHAAQLKLANPAEWSGEGVFYNYGESGKKGIAGSLFAKTEPHGYVKAATLFDGKYGSGLRLDYYNPHITAQFGMFDQGLVNTYSLSQMFRAAEQKKYYQKAPQTGDLAGVISAYMSIRFDDFVLDEIRASGTRQKEAGYLPGKNYAAIVMDFDPYRRVSFSTREEERTQINQQLDADGNVISETSIKNSYKATTAGARVGLGILPFMTLTGFGFTSGTWSDANLQIDPQTGKPIGMPLEIESGGHERTIYLDPSGNIVGSQGINSEFIRTSGEAVFNFGDKFATAGLRVEYSLFPNAISDSQGNKEVKEGMGASLGIDPVFDAHQYQFSYKQYPWYDVSGIALVSKAPGNLWDANSFWDSMHGLYEGAGASWKEKISDDGSWKQTKSQASITLSVASDIDVGVKYAYDTYKYNLNDYGNRSEAINTRFALFGTAYTDIGNWTLSVESDAWRRTVYREAGEPATFSVSNLGFNINYSITFR